MIWADYQIQNLESGLQSSLDAAREAECSRLLLDWIARNPFLRSEPFENEVRIAGKKFFRFSIAASDSGGNDFYGFGRSENRLRAASISAGELIERYIAKQILKSQLSILANHEVDIRDSSISIRQSATKCLLSSGFHSSNGWAVHFSLGAAIESAVVEALERHILLYTFLHSGWGGFQEATATQFREQKLIPYLSCFAFGGYRAGMVATTGVEFAGTTFGYLCDRITRIFTSKKWSNAFFESFGQWESLTQTKDNGFEKSWLTTYQRYYLNTPRENCLKGFGSVKVVSDRLRSNMLMIDLKKALGLSFPLFATYCFGGDLIPLFFKQKLSATELSSLRQILEYWKLPLELPEYHPIL